MSNYLVTDTELSGIADIIRAKNGESGPIAFPSGFESGINNLFFPSWMGAGFEPYQIVGSHSWTLNDTSWASYTPNTNATSIKSYMDEEQITLDMANYEYMLVWSTRIKFAYQQDTPLIALPMSNYCFNAITIGRRPLEYSDLLQKNCNYNVADGLFYRNMGLYYSTAGNYRVFSSPYAIYTGTQNVSMSSSTASTATVTPRTPTIYARCNAGYFSTSSAALVDPSETTIDMVGRIWRFPLLKSEGGLLVDNFVNWMFSDIDLSSVSNSLQSSSLLGSSSEPEPEPEEE